MRLNRELEDTNRGVVALYAELDEKADHLRRADELKSRFLSNMSHEFRSPLNSILALSGLLLDRVRWRSDRRTGAAGGLHPESRAGPAGTGERSCSIWPRWKPARWKPSRSNLKLPNLFAALRGMLRPLLLNQSVDLVFEDADQIPHIYSDEGKVSQILRNFISNALKFTERGEIRVSAALGW